MATDLEKLVVQLSGDIRGYQREMRKAMGVTNKQARDIENRYQRMNKNLDSIGRNAARSLIVPLSGVAAAMSVREVVRYADAWTRGGNVIAAAGQVAGRAGRSLEGINEIANRTRAGFTETADLYAKLLRSTAGVAKSELEVARATEIVNKAFSAGGAATSEMSAGILQLAQGLGSGVLQGDELRSIRENAPLLAKAIADYYGTTIAGLKALGAEGKLTSEGIFKAILSAQSEVEAAFGKTNQTIENGITKVRNALTQYIGQTDDGLSATERLVAGLNALADNFDNVADVTLKLAAVIAGALVGRSIAGMITKLGLGVVALTRFTAAIRAASTMAGLSASFAGLGAAAGPVGLVIGGAVVGALALFSSSSAEAAYAAKTYAEALELVESAAEAAGEEIEDTALKIDERMKNALTGGVEEGIEKIEEARVAVVDLFNTALARANRSIITPEQLDTVRALRDELASGETKAEDVEQALFALANSNPDFQVLAEELSPLLQTLANAIAATEALQSRLAGLSAPSPRQAESESMAAYGEMVKVGKAFTDEAMRRANLTKEQLALENEIASVRKAADEAGAIFTKRQIEDIARANLAGDAARSASGKKPARARADEYASLSQRIAESTAALIAETEAQRQLNPTIDDFGYAVEKARAEFELMNAAKKAGLEITPALTADITQLSEGYALATSQAGRLAESQDKVRESAEDMRDLGKNVMGGFIRDLQAGKSASEALAGALQKVADKLLDVALNSIFDGGGGLGGFLGALFGGGGGQLGIARAGGIGLYHSGGIVGSPSSVRSGVHPGVFAGAPRYHEGGIAGLRPGEVPAILQRGELVIPKGGAIGGGGVNMTYAPVYNVAQGADPKAIADLQRAQAKDRAEFKGNVLAAVRDGRSRRILQ